MRYRLLPAKKVLDNELKKYIIKNGQLRTNQLNSHLKQIIRTDLVLFAKTFNNLPDMEQKCIDTGVSGICKNKLDFFYKKYLLEIYSQESFK